MTFSKLRLFERFVTFVNKRREMAPNGFFHPKMFLRSFILALGGTNEKSNRESIYGEIKIIEKGFLNDRHTRKTS